MKLKIIAVGRIKENFIKIGLEEYLKRLPNLEILEIKDLGKIEEGKKIIEKIERLEGFKIVALDENGVQMTSVEFSNFIKNSGKNICFIIGGPDGLDSSVISAADESISLSRMTFTHEMARLFLVEQIYRALTLIEGKKYHR